MLGKIKYIGFISFLTIFNAYALEKNDKCEVKTLTKCSGTYAPKGFVCPGTLIFEENFNSLNTAIWKHENTFSGSGNWEFQWYTNNRSNSYVRNGVLFIQPTLLSDQYGEAFLTSGTLNLNGGSPADSCTNPAWFGCERTGTSRNILNPIKSARISTVESFNFQYGRVEVRAKMPSGDWLRPAIILLPTYNAYGTWPASGAIDLVESRGNKQLIYNNVNIGVNQISSTLHFGPSLTLNSWTKANFIENDNNGFDSNFKKYQMEWTPDFIKFSVDDKEIGRVTPEKGFWELGKFEEIAPGTYNPWKAGTKMAPFDQRFYLIIELAIGGNSFFPDDASNPSKKPWNNASPTAMRDFYEQRMKWLTTWKLEEKERSPATLQIDYVKIWAL